VRPVGFVVNAEAGTVDIAGMRNPTTQKWRNVQRDRRVALVVDDVLATGGTAQAAVSLVEQVGGKVCGVACLIELDFLHGRDKLPGQELFTLIHY